MQIWPVGPHPASVPGILASVPFFSINPAFHFLTNKLWFYWVGFTQPSTLQAFGGAGGFFAGVVGILVRIDPYSRGRKVGGLWTIFEGLFFKKNILLYFHELIWLLFQVILLMIGCFGCCCIGIACWFCRRQSAWRCTIRCDCPLSKMWLSDLSSNKSPLEMHSCS